MKIKRDYRLVMLLLVVFAVYNLAGCSATATGYQDEGQTYYDLYMERPGYYDFGRPVISVPDR